MSAAARIIAGGGGRIAGRLSYPRRTADESRPKIMQNLREGELELDLTSTGPALETSRASASTRRGPRARAPGFGACPATPAIRARPGSSS